MKTKTEIKSRGFVPDGSGGYRLYDSLNAEEKKAFSDGLVQRMGETINRYAGTRPEAIHGILKAG